MNVPLDSAKVPLTSTAPDAPEVNVPPEMVKPPLKVWVPVEAEYVPPETVARPVAVTAAVLASKVPAELVSVPATVSTLLACEPRVW